MIFDPLGWWCWCSSPASTGRDVNMSSPTTSDWSLSTGVARQIFRSKKGETAEQRAKGRRGKRMAWRLFFCSEFLQPPKAKLHILCSLYINTLCIDIEFEMLILFGREMFRSSISVFRFRDVSINLVKIYPDIKNIDHSQRESSTWKWMVKY